MRSEIEGDVRPGTPIASGDARAPARHAKRVLWLLAVAAGIGVANLYYAQPLAAAMASTLGATARQMGTALTLSQLGYAAGMLVLVPLGDGRERRSIMVATAATSTVALLATAAAPTFLALAASSLLLGFTSSLPQMIVPYACGVVPSEERGAAIGTVMAGLLSGVLLSRTVSGTLASVIGWRATFVCAAVLMSLLTVVLRAALQPQRPELPLPWARIMASMAGLLRSEPLLRRHALIGAMGFAAFSVFWSTLAFHLATLGYGTRVAGGFGVLGLAGIGVAPVVGRMSGRVAPAVINATGLASIVVAFGLFWWSTQLMAMTSMVVLGLGVVLLDAGVQGSHIANQTAILGLDAELRNRLNAVYMVAFFAGGALGTSVATLAWSRGGWSEVCFAGAGFSLVGLVPLLRARFGARAHAGA
jgi:predicted MFS family arabinose efflux permease